MLHLPHWSFAEMRTAFGFSLDQYLYLTACSRFTVAKSSRNSSSG
jgi:hypothetical protein